MIDHNRLVRFLKWSIGLLRCGRRLMTVLKYKPLIICFPTHTAIIRDFQNCYQKKLNFLVYRLKNCFHEFLFFLTDFKKEGFSSQLFF